MSKQIENNVVQMTFDNRDFERNISTSTKSIEKLNEELKFKDANKGFQDLEKYANKVNFDGLNKAIENINSVFTVTGNLCKKVVDDIAGYFEDKIVSAVNFVKSKTIDIMDFQGANEKYKQYTTGMNTLVANMTKADRDRYEIDRQAGAVANELEYIDQYAEKLMTFADETSYSFSDMFETIAKFSASNIDMNQGLKATIGLANAAAVAGQNAKTATMSFQQISQAFGRGYVQYQDWMQAFSSKHIATAQFKETFVEAANRLGVLKDEVLEQAKKEHPNNWIDVFFSPDSMNQGWLSLDVLNAGLEEYSKASNYLLENIDKLTSEEELTFSNMLEIVEDFKAARKEAEDTQKEFRTIDFVKSLAAKNEEWGININEMCDALERLGSEEYELSLKSLLAAQQATNFEEAMDSLKDAFATRFMKIMKFFIGDLDQARKLWTGFCDSLYAVFVDPLNAALDGFEAWNKGILTVEDETEELEYTYEVFWGSLGRIFTAIGEFFNGFIDKVRIGLGAFEESKDGTIQACSIIETYTLSFLTNITKGVEMIADAIENFLESDFYSDLLEIFNNIFRSFMTIKRVIFRFLGTVLIKILKNLKQPLKLISELLVTVTDKLASFLEKVSNSERFNKFIAAIGRLTEKLMEFIYKVLSKLLGNGSKLTSTLGKLLTKIIDKLIPVIDWLIDAIDKYLIPGLDKLIDGPYGIGAALDWLGDKFEDACNWIKNFATNVLGISFTDAKKKISDFAGFVKEKLTGSDGGVFDILFGFIGQTFDANTAGSFGNLIQQVSQANSLAEGAAATLNWTGDALMRPIKLILDLASEILGVDLSSLATAISNFIHSFTSSLADITPDVLNTVEKIGDLIVKILGFVASIVASIFQYLAGSKDSTGFTLLDKIIDSIKTLILAVVNMVGFIIQKIAKIAVLISPALMEVIDWMGVVIENIANMIVDMVKQFATIKSTDELLENLWRMVKFFLGFLLIMQLLTVITGVTNIVKKISSATNTLSDAVDTLTGGLNKAINGLFGNNFGGMMRTFAVLMLAFGYALSQVVKAGNALADEKTKEGMMTAIAAMIAIIVIFTLGATHLLKAQTTAYDRLQKMIKQKQKAEDRYDKMLMKNTRKTKIGRFRSWWYFKFGRGDKDAEMAKKDVADMKEEAQAQKDGLAGAATLLVSLAAGLLLISKAMSILANASKDTSAQDLRVAGIQIVLVIAALGIFLKFAKVTQKYSQEFSKFNKQNKVKKGLFGSKKNSNIKESSNTESSSFEGEGYSGIAGAIIGLSFGILIISLALSILTKNIKGHKVDMTVATGLIAGILTFLGAIVVLTAKFGKTEDKGEGIEALAKVINSIGRTVVSLIIAVAVIAYAIKKAGLDKNQMDLVKTVYIGVIILVGILGAVVILISIFSKKKEIDQTLSNNTLIKKLNVKFMGVFFSIGSFILMVGAGIWLIVNAINSSKVLSGGQAPTTFYIAITSILGIFVVLGLFIAFLNETSGTNGEDFKAIAAKLSGMALLIWSITGMITLIAGAVVGLAALIAVFHKATKSYNALIWSVSIMGGIMLAITGLIFLISKIAKSMAGSSGDPAKSLLAMAAAIVGMSIAITVLSYAIVGLAKSLKGVKPKLIFAALGVMAAAAVVMVALGIAAQKLGLGLQALAAAGIGLLVVIFGGLAAIGLVMLIGDELIEWMDKNEDKIGKFFEAISKGFVDAIIGLIKGLVERGDELIASLGDLIIVVLVGLTKFVGSIRFVEALGKFIAALVTSLIGALIIAIDEIWNTILEWFDCGSPSKKTQTFGEWLMEGLLNGLKSLWDSVVKFFTDLGEAIIEAVDDWIDHIITRVTEGADSLQELDHQRAESREKEVFEYTRNEKLKGYADYVKEYMEAYNPIGKGYYREGTAEYEKAMAKLQEIQNRDGNRYQYSIEGFLAKSNEEQKMIRDYARQMGYDTTAGFLQGLISNKKPEDIGKQYMFDVIDGMKVGGDMHSPSKKTAYIGSMLTEGLLTTFNESVGRDAGYDYGDALVNGMQDAVGVHSKSTAFEYIGEMCKQGMASSFNAESGASLGTQFANGVTSTVTDKLSGVTTALDTFQTIFNAKTSGNSVLEALSKQFLGTGTNTSGLVFDMTGSNVSFDSGSMNSVLGEGYQDMITMDDLNDTTGFTQLEDINSLGNMDFGSSANWNVLDSPSTTTDLAYSASKAVDDSNAEIINELKSLNSNLIAWREASSKTAIYMNNDVLVGELVEPMDKALGNKAQLKANRGV